MNLGLDFDGTVTADPETFKKIVKIFRDAGHKVYIVTMRYDSECNDIRKDWSDLVDGIIPTGRSAKRAVTWEQDVNIHVWIDDNPQAVHMDAKDIWGTVSPEGTIVNVNHVTGQLEEEVITPHELVV